MTFEKAMHDSCRELGLDGHIKIIEYKKDCHTYAEKIVCNIKDRPFQVKNSYMFLDGVDFCFYNYENEVNFATSEYQRTKNIKYVSILLGHSSSSVTEKYYLIDDMKEIEQTALAMVG